MCNTGSWKGGTLKWVRYSSLDTLLLQVAGWREMGDLGTTSNICLQGAKARVTCPCSQPCEIWSLSSLPTSLWAILPSHSASPFSLPFFRHKASFFFHVWTSFSFTCVASSLSLVHGWFSSVSGFVSSKTPPWTLCQRQLHIFPTPGHLYYITYLFYLYHLLWAAFSCFTCWSSASAKM